jgi:hypothetical protein
MLCIFGSKTAKVTGVCRKLHNEGFITYALLKVKLHSKVEEGYMGRAYRTNGD